MEEHGRATYRISEAARELGISAEWLKVGEKRGFFPPALRHRYYTEEAMERMRKRFTSRRPRKSASESPEVGGGSGSSDTTGG